MTVQGLLGLLRLVSPGLPVGGFSYSRGLEGAVASGWVVDEASAEEWVAGVLEHAVAPLDGAVLGRLHRAFAADDAGEALRWMAVLRASRESRELLLEDEQMGRALGRLLRSMGQCPAWLGPDVRTGFAAMFALAAVRWGIAERDARIGLLWATAEGQVSAALRLLPLGQTAGQRILARALPAIERCAELAAALGDDDIGNFTPGLALASAWHETQYSRLFQS
jgi:urease accessory protein